MEKRRKLGRRLPRVKTLTLALSQRERVAGDRALRTASQGPSIFVRARAGAQAAFFRPRPRRDGRSFQRRCIHQYCSGFCRMPCSS